MREEALRQLMAKLGMGNPERRVTSKGVVWLNHTCPFAPWTHKNGSDRRPSFGIPANDQGASIYNCRACHEKGSTARLVKRLAALRVMNYDALLSETEESERGVRRFRDFDEVLVSDADELIPLEEAMWDGLFDPIADHRDAARFMVKRRVLRETCDKLGLGFDTEKRRIVFPVRGEGGALYGFSGRAIDPDAQPKVRDYGGLPKRSVIMGVDRWRPGYRKLIVEGLIAFGRMHQIGAEDHFDIGALLGSEMTDEKAAILRLAGDTTVLLLDPDDAGEQGVFGRYDPIQERHEIEGAAIGKLWGHVPLVIPEFPVEDMLAEGLEPDVDNLTLDQLLWMTDCRTWRPSDEQAADLKRFAKGWNGLEDR